MIEKLLWLSRTSRKELGKGQVNLSAIAGEIAGELKEHNPDRVIEFHIQDGLHVEGDQELLRLILQNLLENAWKFTAPRTPAIIEFGVTSWEETPAFFVKDNGIGFDMADAERLFQTFVRLHSDPAYPGTGLGLSTVKRIVTRYGGKVWAEGQVGRGATFYFTLPKSLEGD
jgi:hypothetical protein